MKKKNLLIIVMIVMMVSLIGTLVACKPTEGNGNGGNNNSGTPQVEEITDATFFKAMKESENNDISIVIVNDGMQIYSYTNINGKETIKNEYNLKDPAGSFVASDSLIELKSEDFTNAKINKTESLDIAMFNADVADAKVLLGLTGNIKDVTMDISIKISTQEFVQSTVNYSYTANNAQYNVKIVITAR